MTALVETLEKSAGAHNIAADFSLSYRPEEENDLLTARCLEG